MSKQVLRLRLEKSGDARFLSHLDFLRTLTHAFLRAGLPLALTQGYNPHPRVSLALALPLGATSEAEYADLELEESCHAVEAARRLNEALPEGVRVRQVQELPPGTPPLQSQVAAACWRLRLRLAPPAGEPQVEAVLQELQREKSLPFTREKEGKKKILEARPLLFSARTRGSQEADVLLEAVLAAGNPALRAAEFAQLVAERGGWGIEKLRIHLRQIYARRNGALVDPWRLGQEAWQLYHRHQRKKFEE